MDQARIQQGFHAIVPAMRMIHCLRAPVGGLFRHVLDLAGKQAALGHDVGLVVGSEATNTLTEQRLGSITPALTLGIQRIGMPRIPGPADLAACHAIQKYLRPLQPEILHGHGAKGGAYARLAGRAIKASGGPHPPRVFYTPHGGTLHFAPSSFEGRIYQALERGLDGLTDGLIFESAFAARVYGERIGKGRAPRRVIHNGLNEADFAPHQPAADAADVLFVGELRDLKGVDVLLHAIGLLSAGRAKPVRAVIVGTGPDGDKFKLLAANLGIGCTIAFKGALPVSKAFAMGRVLVVPSRKESLPYVVLEAAAAGLPLIATSVGGIPEIVAGTDTPLIPPGDPAALAAAIEAVTADPALAQERASRLRAVVSERFTVGRMTADVLAFYGDRCGARPSA